jgi:hypothetical protein
VFNPPVGKPNHPNIVLSQPLRPSLIVTLLGRLGVAITVNLQRESMFVTVKIEDKVVYRMLPPKF